MKIYNSIYTIPIFNFWKLQTTGDLKYLFINWYDFENVKATEKLLIAQTKILQGVEGINFELANLYIKFQENVSEYYIDKSNKNLSKTDSSFLTYLEKLNENGINFKIGDLKYDNVILLYKKYKSKHTDFWQKRILDFCFQNLQFDSKNNWNLDNEIIILEQILGIKIDYETPTQKYFAYQKRANLINEKQKKNAK